MFLRRGRFRGRERDGNDRGGSQRRFERRGSAPASIEHGAAPGGKCHQQLYYNGFTLT